MTESQQPGCLDSEFSVGTKRYLRHEGLRQFTSPDGSKCVWLLPSIQQWCFPKWTEVTNKESECTNRNTATNPKENT